MENEGGKEQKGMMKRLESVTWKVDMKAFEVTRKEKESAKRVELR